MSDEVLARSGARCSLRHWYVGSTAALRETYDGWMLDTITTITSILTAVFQVDLGQLVPLGLCPTLLSEENLSA